MDILIIANFITEFAKDGTSRFIHIAERLSQSHQVEIVTSGFDHITKTQRIPQDYGLKTKITLLKEPGYPRNVCMKRFVSHFAFGKQVKKYLASRKKPDVIYCAVPSLDCAYYAARYARQNHVKFVIDVQDLWPEAFKMVFDLPAISKLLFYPLKCEVDYIYSNADDVVGVSQMYCDRVRQVNQKNARYLPVYLGTNLACFDQYAEEHRSHCKEDQFVIGYCGTLGHSYDIKCVLDALVMLKENGHTNVKFWIMGDGPLQQEFEAYAVGHDLDISFYGRVPYPEMCGLLASCDVCVNPIIATSAASIINKHGDYAAAGIPVVNTQVSPEYRQLVDSYQCGINCEPSNSQEVKEAILWLMENPKERLRMGRNARKLAEEKFDRNFTYQQILNIICG